MKIILWVSFLVLMTGGACMVPGEAKDINLGKDSYGEYRSMRIKGSSKRTDRRQWEPNYILVCFISQGVTPPEWGRTKEELAACPKILILGLDQKRRIKTILNKVKETATVAKEIRPRALRISIVLKYIDGSEEVWYIDYGGRFEYSNTYEEDQKKLTGKMLEEDFEKLDELLGMCSETVGFEVLRRFPEIMEKNPSLTQ